jgi:thiamine-monophosphate kinase
VASERPTVPGDDRWSEFSVLDRIRARLQSGEEFPGIPRPGDGETFSGDDAAVLARPAGDLLLATDLVVEGVHFDPSLGSLGDAGWKAVSVNVSDIAAMGGRALYVVAAVAAPPGTDLDELTTGMAAACAEYGIALVGGDLSSADQLVIAVAVTGTCAPGRAVLRSGARPGDELWLTGPLGSSAAGLEVLGSGHGIAPPAGTHPEEPARVVAKPGTRAEAAAAITPDEREALVAAYLRPRARLAQGLAAAEIGATAMIDISDGLAQDLDHLARASCVGLQLTEVPVARGATLEQALGGGEDYELAFAVRAGEAVEEGFAEAGLPSPIRIGSCTAETAERTLGGKRYESTGWSHRFG